jgi:hypothetical protein
VIPSPDPSNRHRDLLREADLWRLERTIRRNRQRSDQPAVSENEPVAVVLPRAERRLRPPRDLAPQT